MTNTGKIYRVYDSRVTRNEPRYYWWVRAESRRAASQRVQSYLAEHESGTAYPLNTLRALLTNRLLTDGIVVAP